MFVLRWTQTTNEKKCTQTQSCVSNELYCTK